MASINATIRLKFDSRKEFRRLSKRIDAGKKRGMFQALAYVMTTSRQTMRKRKKPSPPGKPPHRKVGKKEGFGFQAFENYLPMRDEGIVGPTKFPRSKAKTPPNINEFGGTQFVRILPVNNRRQVIAPDGTVNKRKKNKKTGKFYFTKDRVTAKQAGWITSPHAPLHTARYPLRKFQKVALRKAIKGKLVRIFAENILGRRRKR